MGKNLLVGVGGKARHVKALYVGAGGKARKVKKVYVGVGGRARLVYQSYIPVTGISLSVPKANTVVATFTPSNATNKSITWSSSNPGISIVSVSGNSCTLTNKRTFSNGMTSTYYGEAIITVKSVDGPSSSITVEGSDSGVLAARG